MEKLSQSKIGKRSKSKGNRYERRVVKLLHEFTDINFRRVPASGGFNKTGGMVVNEAAFSGDVICDSDKFLYSIEAKNRKSISLPAILKNPTNTEFIKCWEQCTADACQINLKPMMFFKPNNSADWICLKEHDSIYSDFNFQHMVIKLQPEFDNIVLVDWSIFKANINSDKLFNE